MNSMVSSAGYCKRSRPREHTTPWRAACGGIGGAKRPRSAGPIPAANSSHFAIPVSSASREDPQPASHQVSRRINAVLSRGLLRVTDENLDGAQACFPGEAAHGEPGGNLPWRQTASRRTPRNSVPRGRAIRPRRLQRAVDQRKPMFYVSRSLTISEANSADTRSLRDA